MQKGNNYGKFGQHVSRSLGAERKEMIVIRINNSQEKTKKLIRPPQIWPK